MITAIKAEFRKLLSVRSTYFVSFLVFALLAFIGIYVEGYKNSATDIAAQGNLYLANSIARHSSIIALFAAIIALLLFAHEYRYNTIMYTLTNNKSRSTVLLSKIIVVILFTAILATVAIFAGLGFLIWGVHLAGVTLPHQDLSLLTYYAKILCYAEGYALGGLLIIALVRNQVAALVILFIEPSTFEGLMTLLLKQNSVYMPFMALSQVVAAPVKETGRHIVVSNTGSLTPEKGALVFLAYLVGGWIIAWVSFLRRDAN